MIVRILSNESSKSYIASPLPHSKSTLKNPPPAFSIHEHACMFESVIQVLYRLKCIKYHYRIQE